MNIPKRTSYRDDDPEGGSIAPAVAILSAMFLALAGLIIDSSRQLTAKSRAVAYAEEAARAGAQAVDPMLGPPVVLVESEVRVRIATFCATVEASDATVDSCAIDRIDGNQVHAIVRTKIQTGLLGLVGIQSLTATGAGVARPYLGVSGQDAE